jgi:hypothetical protein
MSLKLAKNNAAPYDYYSEGDGSDPVVASATLDQSGGTVTSAVVTAYLVATGYLYQAIVVQPVNEESGVNWQVSVDNAIWAESVSPANMDARSADVVIPIYLRMIAANDNSKATGSYTACNVSISATESP